MKRFGALTVLFLISQLFLFTGCESNDNPVTPPSEVDQRLIGTWLSIDTLPGILPPYNLSVNSITITADKKIYRNGWELSTGKLLPIETYFPGRILKASGDTLKYDGLSSGWSLVQTYRYRFESISLILENGYEKFAYKKTKPGAMIFPIITCDLSYNFMDKIFKNDSPTWTTSAKLRTYNGVKEIYAVSKGLLLRITIPEFQGKGTYPIYYNQALLQNLGGDVAYRFISDSVETGQLVIEEYDSDNKICSGRFDFSIIYDVSFPNPPTTKRVSNGKFTVPIFD
ncbi:MAG: hypothetical protein FMNOHCHN_03906 [Ignavibacteriaceae bacterium]|nr:hypothetical protein [Ignavibacteriaceae bacterium]